MVRLIPSKTCWTCVNFESGKQGSKEENERYPADNMEACEAYSCFAGACKIHDVFFTCGGTVVCDGDFVKGKPSDVQSVMFHCEDYDGPGNIMTVRLIHPKGGTVNLTAG